MRTPIHCIIHMAATADYDDSAVVLHNTKLLVYLMLPEMSCMTTSICMATLHNEGCIGKLKTTRLLVTYAEPAANTKYKTDMLTRSSLNHIWFELYRWSHAA